MKHNDPPEGLSNFGVAVLGFDQKCQCGHEFGLHSLSGDCSVLECKCSDFALSTKHR